MVDSWFFLQLDIDFRQLDMHFVKLCGADCYGFGSKMDFALDFWMGWKGL